MLSAVELDLSRDLDRQTALRLQQRVNSHFADSWLEVTLSGRPHAFSRDPNYTLPTRGLLRFTYALCSLPPLPTPLDGAYLELDLQVNSLGPSPRARNLCLSPLSLLPLLSSPSPPLRSRPSVGNYHIPGAWSGELTDLLTHSRTYLLT